MAHTERRREWIFLLPLLLQWIVYVTVRHQLPQQLNTHFTVDEHGNWVANDTMKPVVFMLFTSAVYLLVFFTIAARYPFPRMGGFGKLQSSWLFKGAVFLFLAGLDIMLLISGASSTDVLPQLNTPLLLVLLLLINIFIFFVFRNAMGGSEQPPLGSAYYHILWAAMHLLITYVMLGPVLQVSGMRTDMTHGMYRVLLGLYAIIGNITYNVRPNYFIGIRTPWTLGNGTVWRQTHRLAGILFFAGGLAGFILTFLLPYRYHSPVLTTVTLSSVGIPFIYSYFLHRHILRTK